MKGWLRKALEPAVASGVEKAFMMPTVQASLNQIIWEALRGKNNWNDPLSIPPGHECAWPGCGCCIDAICDTRMLDPKYRAALNPRAGGNDE